MFSVFLLEKQKVFFFNVFSPFVESAALSFLHKSRKAV